jgi:hypothetical protein
VEHQLVATLDLLEVVGLLSGETLQPHSLQQQVVVVVLEIGKIHLRSDMLEVMHLTRLVEHLVLAEEVLAVLQVMAVYMLEEEAVVLEVVG